jgi:hypothetical protein
MVGNRRESARQTAGDPVTTAAHHHLVGRIVVGVVVVEVVALQGHAGDPAVRAAPALGGG